MSQVQADTITNAAGTGAPNAPNNITAVGVALGLKQYIVGTAYTNGTPNMTSAASGFAVSRGVLVPHQTIDGAWHLRCQAYITTNALGAGAGSFTITLSGVTFKN